MTKESNRYARELSRMRREDRLMTRLLNRVARHTPPADGQSVLVRARHSSNFAYVAHVNPRGGAGPQLDAAHEEAVKRSQSMLRAYPPPHLEDSYEEYRLVYRASGR